MLRIEGPREVIEAHLTLQGWRPMTRRYGDMKQLRDYGIASATCGWMESNFGHIFRATTPIGASWQPCEWHDIPPGSFKILSRQAMEVGDADY